MGNDVLGFEEIDQTQVVLVGGKGASLGELARIEYYTTKDHLGDQGGEAIYNHPFKKKGRPFLIYDTRNGLLYVSGGQYTLPDEGITH